MRKTWTVEDKLGGWGVAQDKFFAGKARSCSCLGLRSGYRTLVQRRQGVDGVGQAGRLGRRVGQVLSRAGARPSVRGFRFQGCKPADRGVAQDKVLAGKLSSSLCTRLEANDHFIVIRVMHVTRRGCWTRSSGGWAKQRLRCGRLRGRRGNPGKVARDQPWEGARRALKPGKGPGADLTLARSRARG